MIKAIVVIGKPGSGKSVMVWYLSGLMDEDRFKIKYVSDRLGLEAAVAKDTKNATPDQDGVKVGAHSKLIAEGPPGHKKVHVLDGVLLNRVHEAMIKNLVGDYQNNQLILLEYAIGPDINFGVGKEPLLQSAKHLVGNLRRYDLLDKVFVVETEASLSVRALRESKRRDAMASETFRAYFPDGGEVGQKEKKLLGKNYHRFYNGDEDHEWYFSEAKYIYETLIKPKIRKS